MRISDWSSDVCSSDLQRLGDLERLQGRVAADQRLDQRAGGRAQVLQALIELRGEVVGIQRLAVERGREQVAVRAQVRSEERRGGKECVSSCRSGWSPCH